MFRIEFSMRRVMINYNEIHFVLFSWLLKEKQIKRRQGKFQAIQTRKYKVDNNDGVKNFPVYVYILILTIRRILSYFQLKKPIATGKRFVYHMNFFFLCPSNWNDYKRIFWHSSPSLHLLRWLHSNSIPMEIETIFLRI